jgi:catechol 2,3-dioxygenase-like lactoylglutathione lyase family enzyme
MQLRCEIFPSDLDATEDFYVRVLGFRVMRLQLEPPSPYLALQRDSVRIGAALRADGEAGMRRPPTGVELVLEVDDVEAEHDRILSSGWPVAEALQERPWGLTDFRLTDPSGYYIRITNRFPDDGKSSPNCAGSS